MKLFITILAAGLAAVQCKAQTDSTKADAADSAMTRSTLTLGAVYCTNADYYGQTAQQKLPYLAAAATYRFKSGIYFTGLAYKLLTDTAKNIASAENVGAGFEFRIGKKLSADLSYNHSFYPGVSPFLQAANPDNGSLALSYDALVKPSLSVDYAFGKSSDVFSTAGISKAIPFGKLGKSADITLTPEFSVVGGTQHFYQTYILQKKLADSLLGILLPPLTGEQAPGSTAFTKIVTNFNILSYNLKLPLDYNRASYVIEASCQFSMLSNQAEAGPGKLNSFFNLSFYYQF